MTHDRTLRVIYLGFVCTNTKVNLRIGTNCN